jgi:hypothetical protein
MSTRQPLPEFARPYHEAAALALHIAQDTSLGDSDQMVLRLYEDLLCEIRKKNEVPARSECTPR